MAGRRTTDSRRCVTARRRNKRRNREDSRTQAARLTKGGGAEPFPLEVLKDLLGHDREHANLPLLVIFVKAFSWDILGVKAASMRPAAKKTLEEAAAGFYFGKEHKANSCARPGSVTPLFHFTDIIW